MLMGRLVCVRCVVRVALAKRIQKKNPAVANTGPCVLLVRLARVAVLSVLLWLSEFYYYYYLCKCLS